MKRKGKIRAGIAALLVIAAGVVVWNAWFSATRIAFVNYQVITLGQIARANDNDRIRLAALDAEELNDIGKYDMVLINGMGLRITAEQRAAIQQAANDGLCVITTMATNPANAIVSADSVTLTTVKGYLNGGGRRNYRNLLTYIRRAVDGKTFDSEEPDAPVEREEKQFYHNNPANPDDEEADFGGVAEYEAFLREHDLWREQAPRIIVTGQMGEPAELVAALEKTGNMVYCIRDMQAAVRGGQADSIRPVAVINMAHGRMGDEMVDYLAKKNILLFAPLNVNRLVDEWEADKMGMNGGFLSQSVVMPEIDGAIRPYALFGHRLDAEGLQQAYAIPERLTTFVETVNNHIVLQNKPNSEKRVAIYYYKGPGQNALTAAGMEVAPSLYNLLVRMKREGYRVENLPVSAAELEQLIQRQGSVFNAYAGGAKADFLKNGNPEPISAEEYAEWTAATIRPERMAEVVALDGEFPGSYIATDDGRLALPCVKLGNVVLLPQLAAGAGDDDFAIVHGTDAAPPHAYVASYLWARYGFEADVMVHFGTHGSLEFTPRKQVALSSGDWADALVGPTPHLYIYSIGDVGEGMIAKRRAYATLQSHLTPPFMESDVRGIYKDLCAAIQQYNDLLYADGKPDTKKAALKVKRLTVQLGIHRELRLDSVLTKPYTEREIVRIETFAEELANEKVTGTLYTMGEPYAEERIRSSVYAMSTEPIAYSLLALDKRRGKASADLEKHKSLFTRRYLTPARELVTQLLNGSVQISDASVCAVAGITAEELAKAREIERSLSAPQDMMARMKAIQASGMKHPAGIPKSGAKHPSWIPKIGKRPESAGLGNGEKTPERPVTEMPAMMMPGVKEYTKEEKEFARLIMEIERTVRNVGNYRSALERSPETEFASILNAMAGGYTTPSPGGDPIANPNTVPTGRNLYAVNAEATPSETAWERGKELAENTIAMYRERHNDSIPRKVSYTLWSGEFVETEGATIAQILYMLGVEPIRDVFGRVTDIRLIPSVQLGRPRIDVVVQTSGQLRDLAASRLFLISRAVEMAAAAKEDEYENFVAQSVVDAERTLIDKGLSPKEARKVSTYRVFGGVNGNYGTGITDMVQSGDRWESSAEIADVYLQNMGAFYGSEKAWEQVRQFALEAALTNTDAVVQPRQSNTWGALSLDHVYEFMGGMNLAVRNVTGKEPDAYLSDYRNRNNMRMQELKEAIGVESRTTIFNPAYIREKMKGGASTAGGFAEIVQNTYGWNVMKPEAIDDELWDEIYDVYVQDKFDLGVQGYFERQNPAALQEMTAVMMETARKGMWNASAEQLKAIAELHTKLVDKYKPSCSGAVCNNAKLREFIASKTLPDAARRYEQQIRDVREASLTENKGTVLKKEEMNASDKTRTIVSNTAVAVLVLVAITALVWTVRRHRKKMEE
ncbi:cobaltochelatase subunit CobN [Bacteroides acidifaciens]|uniref:cobaltochelatase subunit CobN n=3 Tax=Bacteroidales TaxID=171549 RepID=UPI00263B8AA7|nr:cobaltochelatase subunit CobN [Bacteroides acidifaciens]